MCGYLLNVGETLGRPGEIYAAPTDPHNVYGTLGRLRDLWAW